MKIPISWLKDYIDLDGLSVEDIARKLTLAGLEVDEIKYVGLPMPTYTEGEKHEFKTNGISWDREKLVVAEIREVMPHPNADRLTLLDLFDGKENQTVLTGAPNIFHLKGTGKLTKPIKAAYAKEGTTLYDGHAEGLQLMTLKRTKIRGVESYSMVCSEMELGISEEHEGIILLDDDAPVGMPLVDYMGDAVLDISILPNMARNANVIGVARELAALTGRELKKPTIKFKTEGDSVADLVSIEITDPELNPRFVLGLIRDVEIKPSPYHIQRRLRLAGMRPINNIVDATNYAMLDLGQPLHAFDYDVLVGRIANPPVKRDAIPLHVKIITRSAKDGEKLITLDGNQRTLTSMNVLVSDEKGSLALAGVMGGMESEVYDASKEVLDAKAVEMQSDGKIPYGKVSMRGKSTINILLEGAAWNPINIRKTAQQHNLPSEASFRFSRGVHPAMAEQGVKRGLQFMAQWSGGKIAPGLVDEYPLKPIDPTISVTPKDVKRLLGIDLTAKQIAELLTRLEFKCTMDKNSVKAKTPPHRVDIGEDVIGLADVLEEIARVYGYDRIPETRMADSLPPQLGNPTHEWEERVRDVLANLGLQEVVSYRMTSPEREGRLLASGLRPEASVDEYVVLANPIAPERRVMRRSLLASVLENVEKNARAESIAMFEIGPVFEPNKNDLPNEPRKLAMAMTGLRTSSAWDVKDSSPFDFFDMKGRIGLLLSGLRYTDVSYSATDSVNFLHPGKAADVKVNGRVVGVFGELHPLVKEKFEFGDSPIIVAEFDLDALRNSSPTYGIVPVSEFPPVYEDIAIIVDESVPAERVENLIRQTGGKNVTRIRLFDLYRGEQIGAGKKSLAYSLTYQSEKTMTDAEAAAIRNKIVKRLENEVGAKLRS